ncbi:MAG: hypothetical protein LUD52_05665 [Opitutae bacterium]|nr:hypothetical protein [Opitutae bacterium]
MSTRFFEFFQKKFCAKLFPLFQAFFISTFRAKFGRATLTVFKNLPPRARIYFLRPYKF